MPFNPDKINIHELTIEEPEKQAELPFDPEKDITAEDWDNMKKDFQKRLEDSQRTWDISIFASSMKILDPKIQLILDGVDWKGLIPKLDLGVDAIAVDFKIINQNIDIGDIKERAEQIKLDDYRGKAEVGDFFSIAANKKIINPKENIDISQDEYEKMLKRINERRVRGNDWWHFAIEASRIKILNPKIDLGLDDVAWRSLKEELNEQRLHGNWRHFAQMAKNLKILAAERVEITDKGLEFIMPTKISPDVAPEMPEQRNF